VALQSEKQSRAEAQASIARAEAITAEEATNTARLTAIAQREKGIEITEAEKEAEKQATSIRVRARASSVRPPKIRRWRSPPAPAPRPMP
jgi:hypothetical protein